MDFARPSIAILGAGAVGGYYGARMVQAGYEVHFLLRSDYEAVARDGFAVQSRDGDFHLSPGQLHIYKDAKDLPQVDLVIIALKATANHLLPNLIPPLLKADTAILTLQNGLGNEAELAGWFGGQRVMGGLAFVCINRTGPGKIHHLEHGLVRIGEFSGPPTDRTYAVAGIFKKSTVPCEVLESLEFGRWTKLVWNIPFNGLGAAMGLSTDALVNHPAGRKLVTELMEEVIQIAVSQGVMLPSGMIEEQIVKTQSMGAYRSSMQVDREEGRELELEAIFGRPLEVARRAGVKTGALEKLYAMLAVVNAALVSKVRFGVIDRI